MKGISAFILKLFAMITMVIDHLGIRWFQNGRIFRLLGRASMPVYAWFIAESVYYTEKKHSEIPHALRLLFLAMISEVPYDLFFSNTLYNPNRNNVIFTLLIGYLVCFGMHRLKSRPLKLACIIVGGYIAEHFTCSYRWIGVLLIVLFDRVQCLERKTGTRRFRLPALLLILSLYAGYYMVHGIEPLTMDTVLHTFRTYTYSQLGAFLSVPLLVLYNGEQGYHKAAFLWFYRLFYPLHLILALLMEQLPFFENLLH